MPPNNAVSSEHLLLIGEQTLKIRVLEANLVAANAETDRLRRENALLRTAIKGYDPDYPDSTPLVSSSSSSENPAEKNPVEGSNKVPTLDPASVKREAPRRRQPPGAASSSSRPSPSAKRTRPDTEEDDNEEDGDENSAADVVESLRVKEIPTAHPRTDQLRTAQPIPEPPSLKYSLLVISRKDYKNDAFLRDILPNCVDNPPQVWPVKVSRGVTVPEEGGTIYVLVNCHTPKHRKRVASSQTFTSVIPDAELYSKTVTYALRCLVLPFGNSSSTTPANNNTEIRLSPQCVKTDIPLGKANLDLETIRVVVKAQRTGGFHSLTREQATLFCTYLDSL